MLPGFLTTALEIVVILDLCGVIAYFVISGLIRYKKSRHATGDAIPQAVYASQLQPCAAEGPAISPSPRPVQESGLSIYAGASCEPEKASEGFSLTAGLKRRIASLKSKFSYRPDRGNNGIETRNMETDYHKLGRILDSFKEEA